MIDIILAVAFLLAGIVAIGLLIAPFVYHGLKKGKIRKANFISAKSAYERALLDLQETSENAESSVEALRLGREYYAYLHPDLCDFSKDEKPISFRNNAGIIEMKVQSDIQARSLKSKGKVS